MDMRVEHLPYQPKQYSRIYKKRIIYESTRIVNCEQTILKLPHSVQSIAAVDGV